MSSLSQRMRRAAAMVAITALLALPAAVSTAQPAEVTDGHAASAWSAVWDHLTILLADWFGAPAPDGAEHVTGESEPGNLGSTLDPDGLTAYDPPPFEDPEGNLGSTLDPDGDA